PITLLAFPDFHENIYQVTKHRRDSASSSTSNTYSAGSGEEERKGSEAGCGPNKEVQELANHGSLSASLMAHGPQGPTGKGLQLSMAMECRVGSGARKPSSRPRLPRRWRQEQDSSLSQACLAVAQDEVTHRGLAVDQLPPRVRRQKPALYPPESDSLFCFPKPQSQVVLPRPQENWQASSCRPVRHYTEAIYTEESNLEEHQ
uniref:Germinal center associated signaling and motility n=1 Tax=Macrostomum lignano TaxID=282301 RepID=A0A1I8FKD6_9PLAT